MPIKNCQKNNKKGFKWGDNGACYSYNANDPSSRKRAMDKAMRQARAIEANKYNDIKNK